MEKGTLLIITAPHFCAAVVYKERAAPIIHYMARWDINKIKSYCALKKWKAQTLEEAKKSEEEYDRGS